MTFIAKGAIFKNTREKLQKLMAGIEEATRDNDRLHLTVAINYGGRDELARVARRIASEIAAGTLKPEDVGEDAIEARLDTHDMPDPDLVIRTSGEMRTSNYLIWQSAYSEYEFTDTLWPDFTAEELERILGRFTARDRRYGGALTA